MNVTTTQSSAPLLPPHISQLLRRFGPLIAIIAIHIALFYALRSGLVHQVAKVLPREIFAEFITEQPAPAPAPKPAEPKTVPVVKKREETSHASDPAPGSYRSAITASHHRKRSTGTAIK